MKSNCSLVFLGDLVDVKGGKRLPKGVSLIEKKNAHPYIRIRDLNNNHKFVQLDDSFLYVDDETQKTISRYIVSYGDILLSIVGTIGLVGMVGSTLDRANLTENCVKLTNYKNTVNPEYLYYYLLSQDSKNEIKRSIVGAVQPKLPIKNIMALSICMPSLDKQKEIVAMLDKFDSLISNNNRIIKNIDEQIDTLYIHCFLNKNVKDAEWKNVTLGDVTQNIRDRVPSNDVKVLSALNSGELALSEEYFTKQVYSKDISKYIKVEPFDFAYNPARVNIGSIGLNEFDFVGCVSPVYVVFRVQKGYEYFFKEFIKRDYFKQQAITRSSGSVRQSMNYTDFALIEIDYPPVGVIESFNKQYVPLLKLRYNLIKENQSLVETRNVLINKFVSDLKEGK